MPILLHGSETRSLKTTMSYFIPLAPCIHRARSSSGISTLAERYRTPGFILQRGAESKYNVIVPCFVHAHRTLALLCAVVQGTQWLGGGSRWSFNHIDRDVKTLTNRLPYVGPVRASECSPQNLLRRWLEAEMMWLIPAISGALSRSFSSSVWPLNLQSIFHDFFYFFPLIRWPCAFSDRRRYHLLRITSEYWLWSCTTLMGVNFGYWSCIR